MASVWKSMVVVLMVVAMAAAIGRVGAQDACTQALAGSLVGCLDAVQNPTTKPSADCCKGVSDVVKNQLKCLCDLYNNPAAVGNFNMTRILEIPVLCNVKADINVCKTGGSSTNTTAKSAPSPSSSSAPAPTAGSDKKNGALRLTWSLKPLWALGLLWASLVIMP